MPCFLLFQDYHNDEEDYMAAARSSSTCPQQPHAHGKDCFIFRLDFITSILFSSFSLFVIAEFLAVARTEYGDCLIAEQWATGSGPLPPLGRGGKRTSAMDRCISLPISNNCGVLASHAMQLLVIAKVVNLASFFDCSFLSVIFWLPHNHCCRDGSS
jgi:hypothetical protein